MFHLKLWIYILTSKKKEKNIKTAFIQNEKKFIQSYNIFKDKTFFFILKFNNGRKLKAKKKTFLYVYYIIHMMGVTIELIS